MSLWFGVVLLVALVIVVARDERRYQRALRSRGADFERLCDERAARSRLGYPQGTPRATPLSPVNQARPHSVGSGGRAHERQFDGFEDTAG